MPLPLPVLDDRDYQQLVDSMRERLPRLAPNWTDHNASDPGITLLELFAYLGDSLLYRFDRVPDRHYRAFLRLLGCAPRAAQIAITPVVFETSALVAARTLPPGVQATDALGDVAFQTGAGLYVSDARIAAVLVFSGARWEDRTSASTSFDSPFAAFGKSPRHADALYIGFDRAPAPHGSVLRLFVLCEDFAADVASWRALREEWRLGVKRSRHTCERAGRKSLAPWDHYSARVVWEYFDGNDWRPLDSLKDRTRSLSLSGPVRWYAPEAHAPGGVPGHEGKYFIRCRFVEGEYDCPPTIRGLRLNAVIASHAADVKGVLSPQRSNGAAGQRFMLQAAPASSAPVIPAVPSSLRLALVGEDGARTADWREQPDFDRSGPHARHFVLDEAGATIAFGDGRAGAVPEAGSQLIAAWKVGGGARGNVAAGTLSKARGAALGLSLTQPVGACSGAEPETLDAAKARACNAMADQRCATTADDLARLALRAPALPVARAFVVVEQHPDMECLPASGCVTVVIVPSCASNTPVPSAGLCRAVARYIEPRRPLALEVHVSGPRYTVVRVAATLTLERGAERARVFAAADAALKKFFDPLAGGPDSAGWKVGRNVYRSEVLAVLDAIPGVHHVAKLSLIADQDSPALCGDILVCANGLVTSGLHLFTAIDGAAR
ncbi:MAG: putative baseplate assembly protein [Gammaproteobacteria bacterium]